MHHNRIRAFVNRLPQDRPAETQTSAEHFVSLHSLGLAALVQAPWQQSVYQLAFEQAQAVVRPSLLERDVLGVWN